MRRRRLIQPLPPPTRLHRLPIQLLRHHTVLLLPLTVRQLLLTRNQGCDSRLPPSLHGVDNIAQFCFRLVRCNVLSSSPAPSYEAPAPSYEAPAPVSQGNVYYYYYPVAAHPVSPPAAPSYKVIILVTVLVGCMFKGDTLKLGREVEDDLKD